MTPLTPLASTLVTQLDLAPHPEGGHFRRTWTAPTHVETPRGQRATAEPSNPVQFLVPAGSWQRTFARGQAALATCVVSPEFSFEDWTLASAGQ